MSNTAYVSFRMESKEKCEQIIQMFNGKALHGGKDPLLVKFADGGNKKKSLYKSTIWRETGDVSNSVIELSFLLATHFSEKFNLKKLNFSQDTKSAVHTVPLLKIPLPEMLQSNYETVKGLSIIPVTSTAGAPYPLPVTPKTNSSSIFLLSRI